VDLPMEGRGVEAQAFGDSGGVGALDRLAQTGHHGVDLLGQVVHYVHLEIVVCPKLFWAVRALHCAQVRAVLHKYQPSPSNFCKETQAFFTHAILKDNPPFFYSLILEDS